MVRQAPDMLPLPVIEPLDSKAGTQWASPASSTANAASPRSAHAHRCHLAAVAFLLAAAVLGARFIGVSVRELASVGARVSLAAPSEVHSAAAAGKGPLTAAPGDLHILSVQEQLLATLRGPKAELRPPKVLPQSPDACAAAAGVSKVALLFLTDGSLPHNRTWEAWLRGAAGLLPAETAGCAAAAIACNSSSSYQHLISVYLHVPPATNISNFSPMWSSALIKDRVALNWGSRSVLAATRHLLWEAFRDPSNQRFMLLGASHVPVWHPLATWRQLAGEQRSRVAAQHRPDWETDAWRWVPRMQETPHAFPRAFWRKSSRWFVLTRPHVGAVLGDSNIYRAFEEHCNPGWDESWGAWRECPAEEHYVPSLLAALGREGETAAAGEPGGGVFEDWSEGRVEPKEFRAGDVTAAAFLEEIGGGGGGSGGGACQAVQRRQMVEAVRRQFVEIKSLLQGRGGQQKRCAEAAAVSSSAPRSVPLNSACFFASAGQFGPVTAQRVQQVLCDQRLAVMDCGAASAAGSSSNSGSSTGLS